MSDTTSQSFLDEIAVARLLNITVSAIRRWRLEKRGPAFVKVEGAVRYRREDIEAYIGQRIIRPTKGLNTEKVRAPATKVGAPR